MVRESEGDDVGNYIREVRASTQRHARDLLWENEKLLVLALTLNAAKASLEEQVLRLREEVARRAEVHAVIVEQLADAEAAVRELSAGFIDAEQASSNLASLYAASCRLHASLEREAVLSAIEGILADQIGAEEFAIFEHDGERFTVVARGGLEEGRALDAGSIEDIATSGVIHILSLPDAAAGYGPRIVIPLKLAEQVTGAIAIYSLLGHKDRLEWVDHELFDFLGVHAGIALAASALFVHERAGE